MADCQVVKEPGRDVPDDVIDALVVQRLRQVDSNRGRPFLVLAVAQLTKEPAAEHPNVAGVWK